ncbi:MAG: FAD-dependent oxidoreductase [Chlamydiota bacterium]
MKLAIMGGGYAGLSAAMHALDQGFVAHVYRETAEAASHISTGFLHPYVGKFPVRQRDADKYLASTGALFQEVEEISKIAFRRKKGIFRPALFPSQEKHFRKLASKHPDVQFLSEEEAGLLIPGLRAPGILLLEGEQIDSLAYIKALEKTIQEKGGLVFSSQKVRQEDYDALILATGSLLFQEMRESLDLIKGQLLLFRSATLQLPYPLLGHPYLTPYREKHEFALGATYEKGEFSPDPDEKALSLLKKLHYFSLPKDLVITGKIAGFRVYPKEKQGPVLRRMGEKTWAFTGLGSKGLLLHSYFGKQLVEEVAKNVSGNCLA